MRDSSASTRLAYLYLLNRWTRLLVQTFVTTTIIVVAAVVSRGIYLLVAQSPAAEMEDVSDFDRPVPDCHAPSWEKKAPQSQNRGQGIAKTTACLES